MNESIKQEQEGEKEHEKTFPTNCVGGNSLPFDKKETHKALQAANISHNTVNDMGNQDQDRSEAYEGCAVHEGPKLVLSFFISFHK